MLDFDNGFSLILHVLWQVGNYIHNMATFFSGLVIGFVNCWQIALITLATGPFIVAAGGISNIFLHRLAENIQDAYAEAASIAEQVWFSPLLIWLFSHLGRSWELFLFGQYLGEIGKMSIWNWWWNRVSGISCYLQCSSLPEWKWEPFWFSRESLLLNSDWWSSWKCMLLIFLEWALLQFFNFLWYLKLPWRKIFWGFIGWV